MVLYSKLNLVIIIMMKDESITIEIIILINRKHQLHYFKKNKNKVHTKISPWEHAL